MAQILVKSITMSVFRIAAKYATSFHTFVAPKVASGEAKHKAVQKAGKQLFMLLTKPVSCAPYLRVCASDSFQDVNGLYV